MSQFNNILIAGLRHRQRLNLNPDNTPQSVTWGGEDYPCVAGDQKTMKTLGIGGYSTDADLLIVIVLNDLVPGFQTQADLVGKIPLLKQKAIFNAMTYIIDDLTIPPGLAFIVLALSDPNKQG